MNQKDLSKIIDYLEDLKSEDVKKRAAAVRHIHLISEVFGPEKTKQTLLPFLKEYEDDDEEVMIELANQLELLGQLISEKENNAHELLPYYYIILSYEDASVVEAGMQSLYRLVTKFSLKHDNLAHLAKKLFTVGYPKALISSSRIFCELNGYLGTKYSNDINKIITDNINNKYAIVRKETAIALRHLLGENLPYDGLALTCLKKLLKDSQDSVRVFALESLCAGKHGKSYFMNNIFTLVLPMFDQKSWRIRYICAKAMPRLLMASQTNAKKQLIDAYVKLFKDDEKEVSIAAIDSLRDSVKFIEPEDIVSKIIPVLKDIVAIPIQEIKIALAGSILHLVPVISKNYSNEHIKDMLIQLLKDENSQVKVELFRHQEPLSHVISSNSLVAILTPVMKELINDRDWRIREKGLKAYDIYLSKLGEVYCSSEAVVDILKNILSDRVFIVRRRAIELVRDLCLQFGAKWTEKYGLTVLSSFTSNPSYLHRLNYLFGIKEIYHILSKQALNAEVDTISKMIKDLVPNVRFNALLLLITIYSKTEDSLLEEKIIKITKFMENDVDSEVERLVVRLNSTPNFKSNVRKILGAN